MEKWKGENKLLDTLTKTCLIKQFVLIPRMQRRNEQILNSKTVLERKKPKRQL